MTASVGFDGHPRPGRFAIPGDRVRKPLDGDYVRRTGDATTATFVFKNTHWHLLGTRFPLDLLPGGGVESFTGKGRWRVDDGVLHVALETGVRLSLSVDPDGRRLHGDARRPLASQDPEGDNGEFRGAPVYERR